MGVPDYLLDDMAKAAHFAYFDDSWPAEVEIACMRSAVVSAILALEKSGFSIVAPTGAESGGK